MFHGNTFSFFGGGLFKAKIEPLTAKIELYRAEIQLLVLCSAKIQLFSGLTGPVFFPLDRKPAPYWGDRVSTLHV